MRLLRFVKLLLVSLIFNIQITWTMAIPVVDTLSVASETESTKSMPTSITEFKRENLGKVMSVIGIFKNKKLERNTPPFNYDKPEPLFENFKGGEWVLVPLRRDKRLCAVIFASFLQYEVGSCRLITQKNISESCSTEFSSLILPLTDIYLVKKHFELDEHEKPLEYTYILETALCAEFEDWLENCPEALHSTSTKPRSRPKKSMRETPYQQAPLTMALLPESADPNKDENYEILYVRPGFEEKRAPEEAVIYSEKSTLQKSPSSYKELSDNYNRPHESASSSRKLPSFKGIIRSGFKSKI